MAEELIYGIRITGDPGSGISAIGQVLSAAKALDSQLKSMANRAINATVSQPTALGDINSLGGSKDIAAWQQRQELELFRQKMAHAKAVYDNLRAEADKYYEQVKKKEEVLQRKREELARTKPGTKAEENIKAQISRTEAAKAKLEEGYLAKYGARLIQAEQNVFNTAVAYARRLTSIVKQERAEQEKAAKKSADTAIREAKRVEAEQRRVASSMVSNMRSQFANLGRSASEFANSMRLVTQGLSEISRVLALFIAAPLAAIFYAGTRAAVDFEAAMVRVAKTTDDMGGAGMQGITKWIRDFAKYTVSSQTELATFAEQLGQIGVTELEPMKRMIQVIEMMAAATDLSADEVAKSMGRIASAFGYNLNTDEGADNIERLANVINKLENTTAASAGEIVEGLLNVASVGGMLDIPVQDMAAIVAQMESMGVAADAVGNRLARWYQQIIDKSDEFAKMMAGFKTTDGRMYETGDAVLRMLENDPAQLLMDAAEAMSMVNDQVEGSRAKALQQWFDVFGQVGGKVGVLAGNVEGFSAALKNARTEFMSGTSLFKEYDKALMTTDAHMKILRNNLNDAAITVGDAFLPVINRLVEYAIPGIQMLAAAFKSLTWEQKLLIVGLPLLITVLAPILFMVTQLFHGVSMLVIGFKTFFTAAMGLGKALWGVGKGIMLVFTLFRTGAGLATAAGTIFAGLGPTLAAVVGGLAAIAAVCAVAATAGIGVLKRLEATGVDVAGFFTGLADRARKWGENLMAEYGSGLLTGAANVVVKILTSIAEMIASFFEAHSPPEEGPLRTIDRWGSALFTTYLRGFYNADFSILSDVGNLIRSLLESSMEGEGAEVAINRMLAAARENLAKLIDAFNKTGKVSENVLNAIVQGTGKMGAEVKKLITVWLQYEKTQRRIRDLEKQRGEVDKGYQEEVARIAAMNISAEEKALRIREALNKRNAAVDQIDKEKKAEEEKADVLKEELDWQKEFIQAHLDQASVLKQLQKAIDKLAGAMDNLGGFDFGGGGIDEEIEKAKKKVDDFVTTIKERINSAREVIRSFFKGWSGDALPPGHILKGMGFSDETIAEMQKAHAWGMKLRDLFTGEAWQGTGEMGPIPALEALKALVQGIIDPIKVVWDSLTGKFAGNPDIQAIIDFVTWLFTPNKENEGKMTGLQQFFYGFGLALGGVAAAILNFVGYILLAIAYVLNLGARIQEAKNTITMAITIIRTVLTYNFKLLATLARAWGRKIVEVFGEGIGGAAKWIWEQVAKVAEAIADFLEPHSPPKKGPLSTIAEWGGKLLKLFLDGLLNGDFNPLLQIGQKILDAIMNIDFSDVAGMLWDFLMGGSKKKDVKDNLIVTSITEMLNGLLLFLSSWFATNIPIMLQRWTAFRDTFKTAFMLLPSLVGLVFTSLSFHPLVTTAVQSATDLFWKIGTQFANAVGMGINEVAGSVVEAMKGLIDGLIAETERGIDAVNRLIEALKELARQVEITPLVGGDGDGGGGGADGDPATPFAKGGIATRPMLAYVAEAGEAEAIIPLSRLPGLMAAAMPAPTDNSVVLQFGDVHVRNDEDIRKLSRRVRREMIEALREQQRYRGRS
jgi:TP901 family phage tail tape measure protein